MNRSLPRLLIAACLIAGCESGVTPVQTTTEVTAPAGAAPGTCWAQSTSPAVVETVTEQVLVQPAETRSDGTTLTPSVYRTETRQEIVQERRVTWFETPCQNVLTTDFVASLQRALRARGIYRGPITGMMDMRTRKAVQKYQEQLELNSATLSLAAARKLGLVSINRE